MSAFEPLESVRTLSVMPTYRCTAACKHCGTFSNPKDDNWLPGEDMLRAIDQAADAGYKLVVFTGGEATLAAKNLLLGIERAAGHGLKTRLVTNAWWATDDGTAHATVARWKNAGLEELNASTGDQHRRFVAVENVIRALRAGLSLELVTAVMVELLANSEFTGETLRAHPLFQQLATEHPGAKLVVLESPWMPMTPRVTSQYPAGLAVNRDNLASRTGCDTVLTTTTVQADGRIGACCGQGMRRIPELLVGRIDEMSIDEADRRAGDDFLKRWIRVEGPEKILAWAASIDPEIQWENMYAHRCQACMRLYRDPRVRRVIAEHHERKVGDVVFQEWLMFHFGSEAASAVT
jgi:hypothetical protein